MKSTKVPKKDNFLSYRKYILERRKNYFTYTQQVNALQTILEHKALNTYFQPILDVQEGKTFGFEALNRPALQTSFATTDAFYEFIGESNNVFAFECLCRNLSLQRFHERAPQHFKQQQPVLFLNIHPHVLLDANYHSGETRQLLKQFGLSPEQVVFELTERSAVTDFQEFSRVLHHYRQQGYRIAIDDVGSGYNSLKTLIYLKPEFIKIDRSLIQYIDQQQPQQHLLEILLNYAKQVDTKVIAEGVERVEELHYLQTVGVHYAQGYAIGKPAEQLHKVHV
ncbi:EAL domain-containing protein [Lysinibacillus sp. KU-BSD001]|uniref:EAL domain-containing protein n=1 Tax=Lysinibacillus sp. KU-BSD001 TaxID=3141328 RepID=UPI0036DFF390